MNIQTIVSVGDETTIVVDGITYKFRIAGSIHTGSNSISINGFELIKDGELTTSGRLFQKH